MSSEPGNACAPGSEMKHGRELNGGSKCDRNLCAALTAAKASTLSRIRMQGGTVEEYPDMVQEEEESK